jgi:hypothetical protein
VRISEIRGKDFCERLGQESFVPLVSFVFNNVFAWRFRT